MAAPCPNWGDHTFKEVYYGHQCTKCDLFFPFGLAPWDDYEPPFTRADEMALSAEADYWDGVTKGDV
jgi:hypothetical protein